MADWSPIAKVFDPLKAGSIDGTDVEPHDRAVWRAMCARYRPNRGVLGEPLLTLFVARLNPQTTEDKLQQVFSKYGDIRRLRLVRDAVTGFSKGYAFIEYREERAISRARRDANKLLVDQHEVFVDFEQERTLKGWVPRRLGGGQGGKKESGQLRFGGRDRPFRRPITLGAAGPPGPGREWDRPGPRDRDGRDRHNDGDWGGRGRREGRIWGRDRDRDREQDRGRERDDSGRYGDRSRHRDRR